MWFVIRGNKPHIELLENEWDKITIQTGWKLQLIVCFESPAVTTSTDCAAQSSFQQPGDVSQHAYGELNVVSASSSPIKSQFQTLNPSLPVAELNEVQINLPLPNNSQPQTSNSSLPDTELHEVPISSSIANNSPPQAQTSNSSPLNLPLVSVLSQ